VKGGEILQSSLLRTNEELTEIYSRHVDTVYRVCFMFMKNGPDTEDMVQNTFIRLMRDNTVFQSIEHEKAWLIRTATNLCKDYLKHWWQKRRAGMDEAEKLESEPAFEADNNLEMVLNLPPKYKTAVYLYYYEGYKTAEIAKMLGKNESTIRGWLYKSRQLLKLEMEGDLQ